LGIKLEWLFDFEIKAVDSFLTMLRGVDMISDPVSNIPEENDRTELFELDLALVLLTADVWFKQGDSVPNGGLVIFELLVLFIILSDFLDAAEEDLGLPINPKENLRAIDSFSLETTSSAMMLDRGSPS
jgi:hypothetical protein